MNENEMSNEYDFEPEGRVNPWLERTLRREAFYLGAAPREKADKLKRDREPRCFVIRRPQGKYIYAGVRFWCQTFVKDDGKVMAASFHSSVGLKEWCYKDAKNKIRVSTKIPPKNDVLGAFVKNHFDLVAPIYYKGKMQTWENGDPKRNYEVFYCVEAYEILLQYEEVNDPAKGLIRVLKKDGANQPLFSVNPKPWILELRKPWWDQLKNRVLQPNPEAEKESQTFEDLDGQPRTRRKFDAKLPTNAVSSIVLKLYARTGDRPETGDANVEYSVEFSPSLTFDSLTKITPVDELPVLPDNPEGKGGIDWHQIYPPMTQEDSDRLIQRSLEAREEPELGEAPGDMPSGQPVSAGQGKPVTADDIPF